MMVRKSLVILVMLISTLTIAQKTNKNWSVGFGANAVDLFPVGEKAPQGEALDEFFNVKDHWNLGIYIDVNKSFTERLSVGFRASYNQISKWGEINNDDSILVDNLDYIGFDGAVNFNILKNKVVSPFVSVGGGYTFIEEGLYNTLSNNNGTDNLVGAGSANGALGINFNLSDNVAIKAQSVYKHSFEDYLSSHLQHSVGFTYIFGNNSPEVIKPDADEDGVPDENDLCPEVAGIPEYAGCNDTDGDGTPDSLDNCPNVKGTDKGCPDKANPLVTEAEANLAAADKVINELKNGVLKDVSTAVYFEVESAALTNNAKQVLDVVLTSFKDKEITVTLNGYADSRGSSEFNNKLSQNRAKNVLDYFVSKGISTSVVTTNNFGETNPIGSNDSEEGRALNRRTEIKVSLK